MRPLHQHPDWLGVAAGGRPARLRRWSRVPPPTGAPRSAPAGWVWPGGPPLPPATSSRSADAAGTTLFIVVLAVFFSVAAVRRKGSVSEVSGCGVARGLEPELTAGSRSTTGSWERTEVSRRIRRSGSPQSPADVGLTKAKPRALMFPTALFAYRDALFVWKNCSSVLPIRVTSLWATG